ncbi:MAG: hypothetical protein IK127_01120 [Clostridia bacterium]|nr:hypothetical protein [Clostridia bacterium]
MERKLAALFDFQKFENNSDLQKVIDAVHARSARRELSMEDLEYVNAAQGSYISPEQNPLEKPRK